jgi:hypothetical protein
MQLSPFTTSVNASNQPPEFDPHLSNVGLLIQGEGIASLPTSITTYVDDSSLNSTMLNYNSPGQGRPGPYLGMGSLTVRASAAASPTAIYTTQNATDFAIGMADDWSFEAFIYITSYVTVSTVQYFPIFQTVTALATPTGGSLWIMVTPTAMMVGRHGGLQRIDTSGAISTNTWHHIAVGRANGVTRMFLNGVERTTYVTGNATSHDGVAFAATGASLGFVTTVGSGGGFISGARFVKGTCLYTENFTPPTAALGNVTNTRFLYNGDKVALRDSVGKCSLFSNTSTASRSNAISKFNLGSVFFNGTDSWIRINHTEMPNLFTGDFTLEWWQYATSLTNGRSLGISSFRQTSGTIGFVLNATDTGSINFSFGLAQNPPIISTVVGVAVVNTWQHIALTRSGSAFRLFVNGILVGSATLATTYAQQARDYVIGSYFNATPALPATSVSPFQGYIDELRVTSGVARYTEAFTPQAAPGANPIEAPERNFSNVVLLANASGPSSVADYSPTSLTLTPQVGVTMDDTVVKFAGERSMSFTPATTGISVPYSPNFNLGLTEAVWTIEAWVYLNDAQSGINNQRISIVGSGSSDGWQCDIGSTGLWIVYPNIKGSTVNQSIPSGQWHHIVWQRNLGVHRIGFNGTILGALTNDGTVNRSSTIMRIGGNAINNTGIGYRLYDVRVTNLVNRYPMTIGATYEVPTNKLPRS